MHHIAEGLKSKNVIVNRTFKCQFCPCFFRSERDLALKRANRLFFQCLCLLEGILRGEFVE